MPDLDRFRSANLPRFSQISRPAVPQPRGVDSGAALKVAGEGIKNLAQIAEQFRQRDIAGKVSNAKVDILGQMNAFEASLAGRSDYENFIGEYQQLTDGLREKYGKEFKDRQAQEAIGLYLDERSAYGGPRVALAGWKVQRQRGNAEALIGIKNFQEMIRTTDSTGMDVLKAQFVSYVKEQETLGHLSPGATETEFKAFDYIVKKEQTWRFAHSQPYEEGLKFLRDSDNLPDISDTDRKGMIRELKQIEGERRAREAEADAELQDKLYQDFAKGFDDGTLTADGIKASGASGPLMEQYLGKLRTRADAQLKGDDDPFEIRDPQVYGQIRERISLSPETVTQKWIWDHHGKGLRTEDASKLEKVWKNLVGEEPKDKNGHNLKKRADAFLVEQRILGIWEEDKDTEGILKNWRGYMETAEALDQLFETTPDITNEIVDKFMFGEVEKVKEGLFKKFLSGVSIGFIQPDLIRQELFGVRRPMPALGVTPADAPAPTSESAPIDFDPDPALTDRENAIKFLNDNRFDVTEENIQKAMRQF